MQQPVPQEQPTPHGDQRDPRRGVAAPGGRLQRPHHREWKSYYFHVVIDMFSRWPEVAVVSSTAFNKLQPSLERIWALHGKPDIITMIMFPHMTAESGGNMPSRSGSLGSHAVHASSPTSAGLFPLTGMELNGYHDLVPQTRPALLLTLPLRNHHPAELHIPAPTSALLGTNEVVSSAAAKTAQV